MKQFGSLSDEELSDMYEITRSQYGDPRWLYEPTESDKALLIREDQLTAFCLYSLVSENIICEYSYSDYTDEVSGDSLIINHIIVRGEDQGRSIGRQIMEYLFSNYDEKVLCKAWVPSDEGKNKFFEKMGFSPIDRPEKPWSHVEFECLGCGRSDGCVCSGVVYAKT